MKFGICGGIESAKAAAEAGYDFIEGSVAGILCPLEEESVFEGNLSKLESSKLPVPVVNCFVPGSLKICGSEVDFDGLCRFATTALRRARVAGIKAIVFGSGGARSVPEDYPRDKAWEQLRRFCDYVGEEARANDVTVVLEPLNGAECNVLTSVGECSRMVREVDSPGFQLLVDSYHWLKDDNSMPDLEAAISLVQHIHVATAPNRLMPGEEICELGAFLRKVAALGYGGRFSIEGRITREQEPMTAALDYLKAQLQ